MKALAHFEIFSIFEIISKISLKFNKKMKLLIQSIIISIIMVMLTILYSISNHNYNYYLKKILENNNYNIIEYKKQNDSKEIFVDIDDVNELSNNVYPIYKLNAHNKLENFLCINDSNNLSDVKILVSNNNNINVNIIGVVFLFYSYITIISD